MSYEIEYCQIDIPELDKFLEEYYELCKKHGIQFVSNDYGYDGGCYITIEAFDKVGLSLNLDKADDSIPFIARIKTEVRCLKEHKYKEELMAQSIRLRAEQDVAVQRAIIEGIVLDGKKYKLIPQ